MVQLRIRSRPSSPSQNHNTSLDESFTRSRGCRPDWSMPSSPVLGLYFQSRFIERLHASTFDRTGKCFCALVIDTANNILNTDLAARRPTNVRDFFAVMHAFCSSRGIQMFINMLEHYDRTSGRLGAHETFVTDYTFARFLQGLADPIVDPNPFAGWDSGDESTNPPRISQWQHIKYSLKRVFVDKQGRPWFERLYKDEHGRSRIDSAIQRGLSVVDRSGLRRWSERWRGKSSGDRIVEAWLTHDDATSGESQSFHTALTAH